MSRLFWRCFVSSWLGFALAAGYALAAPPTDKEAAAAKKVRAALRAEIAGQPAQRAELLAAARLEAPQFAPAQWHSGYLRSGRTWATVEESQRRAAADKRLDDYSLQRATAGDSAGGQLAVANWCRAKGLVDQERLHLMKTLQFDPKNAEAARRLDVKWVGGQWLSAEEIAAQQEDVRAATRHANKWTPVVRGWRDAMESKDAGRRARALSELHEVADVAALPTLEKLLVPRSSELALEVVEAARRMPQQAATDFLLRQAVLSPDSRVARGAIEALKTRDAYSYLPQLLSGLALPIEHSSFVTSHGAGVSFFQETQDAKHYVAYGQGISRILRWGLYQTSASVQQRWAASATNGISGLELGASPAELIELNREVSQLRREVEDRNRAIATRNARIGAVLSRTTDTAFSDDPHYWWGWWTKRSETYSAEKPTYSAYYWEMATYNVNRYYDSHTRMSCFPAGTPVWGERGLTNIEQIQPGDRVLSKDQDTGELKFQAVLRTTLRPECPLTKVRCGSETFLATRGHPFWVSGLGWRMAKDLKAGDLLHGLHGSVRIDAVEEEPDQRAYNLVVDGFNTYFVGQTGLLVHDNVLRKPTACVLPGLKKSELAAIE